MKTVPCLAPKRYAGEMALFRRPAGGQPSCHDRSMAMTTEEIEQRLEMLRIEHRDLDCAIRALGVSSRPDQLQLARLKKRKLRLRDEIHYLENGLIPDIIA